MTIKDKTKTLIDRFEEEVMEYSQKNGLLSFRMKIDYDESDNIYFFYHYELEIEDLDFYDFVVEKIDEYFFINHIETCFVYKYDFAKEVELSQKLSKFKDSSLSKTIIEDRFINAAEKDYLGNVYLNRETMPNSTAVMIKHKFAQSQRPLSYERFERDSEERCFIGALEYVEYPQTNIKQKYIGEAA